MSKIFKFIAMGILLQTAAWGASTAVCKGCHGQNWEKAAMGKAKVVKNMSKAQIIKALKGYKNGTYGGPMKGLMKAQVKSLSVDDIKKMAASIKK
ncbi:MAG: Periplasmic nitrate reductase, small subunit [uncultured Sulfurovum sp.]|uniref:Periplasmic nitrate reductase, small subunit n=1 Tax=uncultured Sulfurovum sp. TaxID=269237 RepID=A0A6S6TDX1_9BACT|nr:MAG: Periplasmic nitrate reductase, small subunit [uncultured Sulfurovum sp.]